MPDGKILPWLTHPIVKQKELLAMVISAKKARTHLSADSLYHLLRTAFDRIPDHRNGEPAISLGNALMAGFAMFALKDPSMLAFDQRRDDPNDNFRSIFGIDRVPSDTQMRAILDPVDPLALRPLFGDVFRRLQRGKALEPFVYLNGHYLISLDGTTYYSSTKVHCSACLVKHHRNGSITYAHQMLGASLVHPDLKEVIALAPEPIINQDGHTKNDCERNATRRWLQAFRREHPHLPVIIIEDGLSANAPHLRDLREARVHYIIGVKHGDHAFLFEHLRANDEAGRTQHLSQVDPDTGVLHHFRWHSSVPLNESNPDELVNVLEYWEIQADGSMQYFSWITDLPLSEDHVYAVMRGGRARWKIENETFNTLKNQGYHFEHNYGHGAQSLSVVLALLMMLAFLVDQTQQLCCPLFQAAWAKMGSKRHLWEELRSFFRTFLFPTMTALLAAVAQGIQPQPAVLQNSS